MAHGDNKSIASNTAMLFVMSVATMVFPLITFPYLTRVLSREAYGTIVYIKAVMSYMQTLVDFGFILSATKDVVNAYDDKHKIGQIASETLVAKILLCIAGSLVLLVMVNTIPILKGAKGITFIYYCVTVISIFLFDFIFRGIEKMHVSTVIFVTMKCISTAFIFVFVKSDMDLFAIPLSDVMSSIVVALVIFLWLSKHNIKLQRPSLQGTMKRLKESSVYFFSNVASLSFTALNTVILGIVLKATDIAYWGVCMQIIGAIQSFYFPISNGVFPAMVLRKEFGLIKRYMKLFMPIITLGCIITYFYAHFALRLFSGNEYVAAAPILKRLIPVLFFGFPSIMLGWPSLGAIGKAKENSMTTIFSVIFQIVVICAFVFTGRFSVMAAAWIRCATEIVLCIFRLGYCYKYRNEFSDVDVIRSEL